MADSQLPRYGCLTGRSNSEMPRCRRQSQVVYHRVHEDVVRRRCSQRHGTRSEDNKTRRTSLVKTCLLHDSRVLPWSVYCLANWTPLLMGVSVYLLGLCKQRVSEALAPVVL